MADWTTPRTWTASSLMGAALLNVELRDNLNALKAPPFQQIVTASPADISATASTAIPITGDLAVTITTHGGDLMWSFQGRVGGSVNMNLNVDYDGTAWSDRASGILKANDEFVKLNGWITGLASGSHTVQPTWRQSQGNTMTLECSAEPAVFWVREVS